MRRAPLPVAALLAIVAVSGLAPSTAAAQPSDAGASPKAPLSASLSGPAKEAYEAAVILVNNSDCAHAVEKYRQAYDLSKDPRLLFDIAICDRDLRAYAEMQRLLFRYEEEAGAGMSAEQRADVEAALAAIYDLVGTLQLKVSEAGADVSVDSEPVGTTPLAAPLVMDLGKHTLSVKKDGFDAVEQTIEISGGNQTSATITLVRRARPALLKVTADPEATVVIDKKELAHGSFDGALAPGAHEVQVTEPGKKPYEAHLVLGDGEARTLQVTLENERHAAVWPWIAGGAAILVAGACVGGYFLFRQQEAAFPSSTIVVQMHSAGM
jgi:hypothetical protein